MTKGNAKRDPFRTTTLPTHIHPATHPLTSAPVLVQTRAVATLAAQDAPELAHLLSAEESSRDRVPIPWVNRGQDMG